MHQGRPWKEATATVGVHISRSTAYRWLEIWRRHGEAALLDGRHGHPGKLREPVLTFLEARLKPTPETPSREVQAALHNQFGITVSIGHLNHVRSQLGLSSRTAQRKKTFRFQSISRIPLARGSWGTSFASLSTANGFIKQVRGCSLRFDFPDAITISQPFQCFTLSTFAHLVVSWGCGLASDLGFTQLHR